MQLFNKLQKNERAVLKSAEGTLKVLLLRNKRNKPTVLGWEEKPFDDGNVTLIKSMAQENRLSSRQNMVLLNRGEYRLIQTKAPEVEDAELKEAVQWTIKDMLEYPVASATIDVLKIPADPNNHSREKQLFAVAAENRKGRPPRWAT
ncbi:MAG: hypothetical protein D3905_16750 [Candidatus Electrothrix sp. AS4_5]|nr:hypothetical protein [Candidatus Electrothrix gigas]